MSSTTPSSKTLSTEANSSHFKMRLLKDKLATRLVGVGGISVIVFIALIFFYLAFTVLPLFIPADSEKATQYAVPSLTGETQRIILDERGEIASRIADDGSITYFNTKDGSLITNYDLTPSLGEASSYTQADPFSDIHAYGNTDGSILVFKPQFKISYDDTTRVVTPDIEYPFGEELIEVDTQQQPITQLAFQDGEEFTSIAAVTEDSRFLFTYLEKEISFLDESVTWEAYTSLLPTLSHPVDYLLMDKKQHHLFAIAKNGEATSIDIADKESPRFVEHLRLVPNDAQLTAVRFLTGDISLLVGDSQGNITQWSLVRQEDNIHRLTEIRQFNQGQSPIVSISPELARKGFVAGDTQGNMGIYHTTAHRQLIMEPSGFDVVPHSAVSPRANRVLLEGGNGQFSFWHIENEHPEVSWSSLWGKVWYENYSEPDYIWQSSSASDDFEPKYSLVPITFGTLKAAFYAMLLGIPLALCGAIYTAQFMSAKMRSTVKPSIEIMEALPTVILGFLAGLWLAPFIEKYLPGIFAMLVVMPLGIIIVAYCWEKLPERIRLAVPDGWEAALLLPVVIFIIWTSIALSPALEGVFFGGDMRNWLTNEMGIGFDQRNAIVVGLAMGFAVIPIIFSIAEDAVFGVPKHLIQGSLALGATQWQTMIRVVLLTASPGIFSAIMIGLGRAVGETMIVLMATGNTPVMDFSPFQGLRTLSANIAVELPESEVNSTHFRILFLAGLVLFIFTFFVNTLAELVRQSLRKKYSTL